MTIKERWAKAKEFVNELPFFLPYVWRSMKFSLSLSRALAKVDKNGKVMRNFLADYTESRYDGIDDIQAKIAENRMRGYEFDDLEIVNLKDFTTIGLQLPANRATVMAYKGELPGSIHNLDDKDIAYVWDDNGMQVPVTTQVAELSIVLSSKDDTPILPAVSDAKVPEVFPDVALSGNSAKK